MTDIVERLREEASLDDQIAAPLIAEAADEIETLRLLSASSDSWLRAANAEIETLRARAKIHQQVVTEEIETLRAENEALRGRVQANERARFTRPPEDLLQARGDMLDKAGVVEWLQQQEDFRND